MVMEKLLGTIGETEIYTVDGDITQIPADVVILPINAHGAWKSGGLDRAIQRSCKTPADPEGWRYHAQADEVRVAQGGKLDNLQTVNATGTRDKGHEFDNVMFVVDSVNPTIYAGVITPEGKIVKGPEIKFQDTNSDLGEVVYTGLNACRDAGYRSVLIPPIRGGVMLGCVEKTIEETADRYACGVIGYLNDFQDDLQMDSIKMVFYGAPEYKSLVEREFLG